MRGTGKTLVAVEFMTSSSTDTVTATAICWEAGKTLVAVELVGWHLFWRKENAGGSRVYIRCP